MALRKPLDNLIGALIIFKQVRLVSDDPNWQVLRQVVVQFFEPYLDALQRVLRLTAVVDDDCRVCSSVVCAIEAAILLLAKRVPDL